MKTVNRGRDGTGGIEDGLIGGMWGITKVGPKRGLLSLQLFCNHPPPSLAHVVSSKVQPRRLESFALAYYFDQ